MTKHKANKPIAERQWAKWMRDAEKALEADKRFTKRMRQEKKDVAAWLRRQPK